MPWSVTTHTQRYTHTWTDTHTHTHTHSQASARAPAVPNWKGSTKAKIRIKIKKITRTTAWLVEREIALLGRWPISRHCAVQPIDWFIFGVAVGKKILVTVHTSECYHYGRPVDSARYNGLRKNGEEHGGVGSFVSQVQPRKSVVGGDAERTATESRTATDGGGGRVKFSAAVGSVARWKCDVPPTRPDPASRPLSNQQRETEPLLLFVKKVLSLSLPQQRRQQQQQQRRRRRWRRRRRRRRQQSSFLPTDTLTLIGWHFHFRWPIAVIFLRGGAYLLGRANFPSFSIRCVRPTRS